MELFQKLLEAKTALDEAKALEDRASKAYKALQEQALEYFVDHEIQNMKLSGYTFFQYSRPWAKVDLEMPGTKEALAEAGIEYLIKESVNTTALSSWYKEQQELGIELPQSLTDRMTLSETLEVRIRKG